MHPARQHFNLLKPISKAQYDELEAHLKSLFDKSRLVTAGVMGVNDDLEFEVNCIKEGNSCHASFAVAVSGRSPSDRLFEVIVDGFERNLHEIYVIGKPGSGALNLRRT